MRSEVTKFALVQPTSIADAIAKLTQYGPDSAAAVSGATDVISRNKNRISAHMFKYLVDLSGLGLSYIHSTGDGMHIGATTTISSVVNDPNVNAVATVLAQAGSSIATQQIQSMGTVGGDVLQEVWCPYLRNDFPCWRNGGNVCYGAIGDNRYYHSIFGGRLCYANHAGDLAPALTALGAQASIQGPNGSRTVSMNELLPGITVTNGHIKENTVAFNEILTEFHIPTPASGSKSAFYKVRDRGTWDFALASAAVVLNFSGGSIASASVVLGGVDVVPHRAAAAESYLVGKSLSEDVIQGAAAAAVQDATPLAWGTGNSYRVKIADGAVRKALRSLSTTPNASVWS